MNMFLAMLLRSMIAMFVIVGVYKVFDFNQYYNGIATVIDSWAF